MPPNLAQLFHLQHVKFTRKRLSPHRSLLKRKTVLMMCAALHSPPACPSLRNPGRRPSRSAWSSDPPQLSQYLCGTDCYLLLVLSVLSRLFLRVSFRDPSVGIFLFLFQTKCVHPGIKPRDSQLKSHSSTLVCQCQGSISGC